MPRRKATPPAKRGRKPMYSPERAKEVVDYIRGGVSNKDACALAGMSQETFYKWKNEKPEFVELLKSAEADFKRANLAAIRAAGVRAGKDKVIEGQWQANAWLLERKFPEEFGQRHIIQVTAEHTLILKAAGIKASELWEMMIQELAATVTAEAGDAD